MLINVLLPNFVNKTSYVITRICHIVSAWASPFKRSLSALNNSGGLYGLKAAVCCVQTQGMEKDPVAQSIAR